MIAADSGSGEQGPTASVAGDGDGSGDDGREVVVEGGVSRRAGKVSSRNARCARGV